MSALLSMQTSEPQPSEAIFYTRSQRARRINMSIKHDLSVRVAVPCGVPLEKAKEFVAAHSEWIQKHRRSILHRRQTAPVLPRPDWSNIDLRAAQQAIFDRLEAFSKQHNLPYLYAAFRCQRTLWGSCSQRGHISLNIHIVLLPNHLQDYILLHELTHRRCPNHSQAFWSQLDGYCGGNAKSLREALKHYRHYLQPQQQ